MKKSFIFVLLFFIAGKISFAMGIGVQGDFSAGFGDEKSEFIGGAACSMKMDNIPLVIAVQNDWNFCEERFNFCVVLDYWLANPALSDYMYYFAGIGAQAGTEFWKDGVVFTAAPRAVTGFNWIFYDGFMEPFVQVAVQPESKFSNDEKYEFVLKFPVNAGVRFYF